MKFKMLLIDQRMQQHWMKFRKGKSTRMSKSKKKKEENKLKKKKKKIISEKA